jgi:hypothetical protein
MKRKEKIKKKSLKKPETPFQRAPLSICTNVECRLRKAGCTGFEGCPGYKGK